MRDFEDRHEREDRAERRPGRKIKRSEKRKAKKRHRGNCWLCDGGGRVRRPSTPKLRACGECGGTGNIFIAR